jgi:hypothetical protein
MIILIGQDIALSHPLEVYLVVGCNDDQCPLHSGVNGLAEFDPHMATQGQHAAPRGPTRGDVFSAEGLAKVPHRLGQSVELGGLLIDGLGERPGRIDGNIKVPLKL